MYVIQVFLNLEAHIINVASLFMLDASINKENNQCI